MTGARSGRSDTGQATVLVACAVVLAAVVGLGIALVGGRAVDESRAQAAADAVALAALSEGRAVAARVAAANDAVIMSLEVDDGTAVVVVAVGDARATARASASP